jgi:pyruvate dehydrogenase E1 component beta subunit
MQFDAFAYPAFEQIVSHLAKLRNRTRGAMHAPIVVRIPYGGGIGGVEHHSDSSEAYYAHTPGLTVVTPSTPADAYTLLRAAIEWPDPVIFCEPKAAYWQKDDLDLAAMAGERRDNVIGKAIVRRPGTSATVLAYGAMVATALDAANAAADDGWDLEVIDLRSLTPFDDETVCASVRRTGRALVVHEAPTFAGFCAEVAARVTEQCFHHLDAPVGRVGGFDVPYPPPKLERWYRPDVDRILDALDRLVPERVGT